MPHIGKLLIIVGVVFVILGLVMIFAGRIPFVGKLPGDIYIKRGNFSIYFPVVTMLVLSIILTIILNLIGRGR